MQMIIAIIRPVKLDSVKEALEKIGVERMTVCDAMGYGRQRGQRGENSHVLVLGCICNPTLKWLC